MQCYLMHVQSTASIELILIFLVKNEMQWECSMHSTPNMKLNYYSIHFSRITLHNMVIHTQDIG